MENSIKTLRSASAEITRLSSSVGSNVLSYRQKKNRNRSMANILVYSSILILIASIASISYRPPTDTSVVAAVNSSEATSEVSRPSVDQLAVADLAASTAEVAGLSIASEASSAAITLAVNSELAQSDEALIQKPLTFEPTASKALTTYTTATGDNVLDVAARHGVTPETVRWANNLTTDALAPNVALTIPSVDGVVYTTKDGDSIDALAEKYKSDKARIISKNDLELSGIVAGQKIVLPGGILPETERPGYVAPRTVRITTTTPAPSQVNLSYAAQAGNRYSYGYCTWYAYNRRAELGRPIGSFWGNASSWDYAARASGYLVNNIPEVGAIMQNGGGAGHVAIVESKNPNGSIVVSEMNYYGNGGGWNRVSSRSLDAGAAAAYRFIH